MIPNAEHWRTSVHEAQRLQEAIMGYLPGYATPRLVCDVPNLGKRWVHQAVGYDRERGISYWTKNYRTGAEAREPAGGDQLARRHPYYDPVDTLPEAGRRWWAARTAAGTVPAARPAPAAHPGPPAPAARPTTPLATTEGAR